MRERQWHCIPAGARSSAPLQAVEIAAAASEPSMITASTIIRNTSRLTVAYVVRKVLTFAYFTMIARLSNVEITGLYFLAVSLAVVCTSVIDFGLSVAMVREGARCPGRLAEYLNNVLGLKIVLCVAVSLCGVALIGALDYPVITKQLMYIILVMMVFESFAESFYSCLRAHHLMQYEAWGLVVGQVITVIAGGAVLVTNDSILLLVMALLANQIFNCGFAWHCVVRRLGYRPQVAYRWDVLRPLVLIACPLLVSMAFDRVLAANTLLLSWMTDPAVVGMFSVPSSLIGTLQFIPYAVGTAIFPALSALHGQSAEKLRRLFDGAMYALLVVVLPLTVGIWLLGGDVIQLIYGERYGGGARTLQILAFAMIPMFCSQPIGGALNACNRQVQYMLIMIMGTLTHLGAALLLIPYWQAAGVAVAYVCGHSAMLLMGGIALPAVLRPWRRWQWAPLWRLGLATGAMAGVIIWLHGLWHVTGVIVAGAGVFGLTFVLVNGMTPLGVYRQRAAIGWIGVVRHMIG